MGAGMQGVGGGMGSMGNNNMSGGGVVMTNVMAPGPAGGGMMVPNQLVGGGGSRKARSYMSSKVSSRASPYSVPGSSGKCDCDDVSGRPGSWAARKRYPSMSASGKPKIELDDPLEMLQELIRLAARFSTLLLLLLPCS